MVFTAYRGESHMTKQRIQNRIKNKSRIRQLICIELRKIRQYDYTIIN